MAGFYPLRRRTRIHPAEFSHSLLALRNHNRTAARLVLTVQLRCDFADIFDVKAGRIVSRGSTASRWLADEGRLETMHANGSFRRGVSVCPADGSPRPEPRDGALSFTAELAPQGAWTAELLYQVIDGEQRLEAPRASFAKQHDCEQAHTLAEWRSQAMRLRTPCASLQQFYDQSRDDLAALCLPIGAWMPHASSRPPALPGSPPCSGGTA